MNTGKAIVTLEVVKFHDDFLEVVRVAAHNAVGKVDGEYWVSVRKVCENLGIDFKYQHQKLKSDPAYDTKLIKVKTAGGMQEMFCIPLNQLNGWLYTINPNKVKAVAKEKLLAYKKECQEVLYNHFIQKASTQPPAGCPATQFDSRINGYKSQLAQRKKEIEHLRFELIQAQEKIKELEKHSQRDQIFFDTNFIDLAGGIARHNIMLNAAADQLEMIAKDLRERSSHTQYFLDNLLKFFPKAKRTVEKVKKYYRRIYPPYIT